MGPKQPERLRSVHYVAPNAPFHVYHQSVAGRVDLHWHEFYELCFVRSGRGTNIVNGEPQGLEPDSMFLLTPADFHEIELAPGETMEILNLVFLEEVLTDELRELLFPGDLMLQAGLGAAERSVMQAEFDRVLAEFNDSRPGGSLMIKATLTRMLVGLARQYRQDRGPSDSGIREALRSAHPGMQKALMYVHHHFREALTLEEVARQAKLTPNYFSHTFRKLSGIPFQSYLQELRLTFAKSLLAASDLPVTEVCHASGFNTLTHFERAFKKRFGCPPSGLRKGSLH